LVRGKVTERAQPRQNIELKSKPKALRGEKGASGMGSKGKTEDTTTKGEGKRRPAPHGEHPGKKRRVVARQKQKR